MGIPNLHGLSAYDHDPDIDELLDQLDADIVTLARKQVPRRIVQPEVLDLEIDELVQNTRIKLWLASRKKHVTNPKAYVSCIVHTESVDMVRRHKPAIRLPIDEDGELYQGAALVQPGEGMQDPADEFEQEEVVADYITKTVDAILTLPPRQQHAIICSLKDELDNTLQLVDAFRDRKMDIEQVNWPREKDDMKRLKASLSVTREKLRSLKRT